MCAFLPYREPIRFADLARRRGAALPADDEGELEDGGFAVDRRQGGVELAADRGDRTFAGKKRRQGGIPGAHVGIVVARLAPQARIG
jgi:hypothetical protein